MSGLDRKKAFKKNRNKDKAKSSNRVRFLLKRKAPIDEVLDKRFKTVFVGAISKIEESFGGLWGGDEIDEEKMTEDQEYWYDVFLGLRDKIFDQGNQQKKQCVSEISRILQDRNIQ